jgi:tetratricopeptide (TPR) repeat protein
VGIPREVQEGKIIFREVMQEQERSLGHEGPDTASTKFKLAFMLYEQGRYKMAERMHQQAPELREKFLSAEHAHTLDSIGTFAAGMLRSQRNCHKSETMKSRVIETSRRTLGPEHPQTVTCIHDFALIISSQGKYAEAEKIYRRVVPLQLDSMMLFPQNRQTLNSMNNLAVVLGFQSKYHDAGITLQRALELSAKLHDLEHPDTLTAVYISAKVLGYQSKIDEANMTYQWVLVLKVRY